MKWSSHRIPVRHMPSLSRWEHSSLVGTFVTTDEVLRCIINQNSQFPLEFTVFYSPVGFAEQCHLLVIMLSYRIVCPGNPGTQSIHSPPLSFPTLVTTVTFTVLSILPSLEYPMFSMLQYAVFQIGFSLSNVYLTFLCTFGSSVAHFFLFLN